MVMYCQWYGLGMYHDVTPVSSVIPVMLRGHVQKHVHPETHQIAIFVGSTHGVLRTEPKTEADLEKSGLSKSSSPFGGVAGKRGAVRLR